MPETLTAALLRHQDDVCSSAVLHLLRHNTSFHDLAKSEGESIVQRDKEDDDKLAEGIKIAVAKGVLKGSPDVSPVVRLNVVGLTARQVTAAIIQHLPSKEGNVIILQGLSGTGKGTTVSKLQKELPYSMTWSNGNVFRSYTYLCNDVLQREGKSITRENLTPELLQSVQSRVSFEKGADGNFHIMLDHKLCVTDIQNTILKAPQISRSVPTVAEQTQGEVIHFAAAAVEQLRASGYNVILEGRAQTLNYIPTKLRFELVIPDVAVLGQRRAAQRVMAKALSLIKDNHNATHEEVVDAVLKSVEELHALQ